MATHDATTANGVGSGTSVTFDHAGVTPTRVDVFVGSLYSPVSNGHPTVTYGGEALTYVGAVEEPNCYGAGIPLTMRHFSRLTTLTGTRSVSVSGLVGAQAVLHGVMATTTDDSDATGASDTNVVTTSASLSTTVASATGDIVLSVAIQLAISTSDATWTGGTERGEVTGSTGPEYRLTAATYDGAASVSPSVTFGGTGDHALMYSVSVDGTGGGSSTALTLSDALTTSSFSLAGTASVNFPATSELGTNEFAVGGEATAEGSAAENMNATLSYGIQPEDGDSLIIYIAGDSEFSHGYDIDATQASATITNIDGTLSHSFNADSPSQYVTEQLAELSFGAESTPELALSLTAALTTDWRVHGSTGLGRGFEDEVKGGAEFVDRGREYVRNPATNRIVKTYD